MESGKTPYEYERLEYKERHPYEKIARRLYEMPDWYPCKCDLVRQYEDEIYSQIPSEKAADEYALKHITGAMKRIREFLGYTEQDLNE